MFPDPAPWRAPFPNYEASIRRLEFHDPSASGDPLGDDLFPALAPKSVPAGELTWVDEHIELSFDDGIVYQENFTWRGMDLRLKVWGPVLKGHAGLGVRLRGLRLRGYPVEVRARATTDLQDLQLQFAF